MMSKQQRLRPLMNYLGSKAGSADRFIERMPPEAFEARAELFAGAHGIELALPRAKRAAILNDLDADVIGVPEAVASEPEAVMSYLRPLRSSRVTFNRIRDLRHQPEWHELPSAQRAAFMIYCSRESVNSNMHAFSVSAKRRSSFNPNLDLLPYAERYEGVTFTNFDWKDLMHRFVFKPSVVTLFVFADPPFVVSNRRRHYRYNFDGADHLVLARTLARVNELNDGVRRNVKIMVSYDDDPAGYIRSLYRPEFGWYVEKMEVSYDAGNHSKRRELIITNYLDPDRGEA